MMKKLGLIIFTFLVFGKGYADGPKTMQQYKVAKPIYLTADYIDRRNKTLSKETAVAFLSSTLYARKSYTAFQVEVPEGTVMTILGPAPKPWYLCFQGDIYFIKLEPDMSQGLDIKIQLDRGMDGNLDGLNPEIFNRM